MNFSRQKQVLTWWCAASPAHTYDALICDGAVRSGKTMCMALSFLCWATACFDGAQFGICGKSVSGVRRNVVAAVEPWLRRLGLRWTENRTEHHLELGCCGRSNRFYLFGGYDEKSAALIQGITFAGVLLDEAALMPRSFVEQACARCSMEGARLWFNCNPEGPQHWFYREWILKAQEKNALHLHFTMEDNPTLSEAVKRRYRNSYSGAFYRRFILGEWTQAQGLVYDFSTGQRIVRRRSTSRASGMRCQWIMGRRIQRPSDCGENAGRHGTVSANIITLPAGKGDKKPTRNMWRSFGACWMDAGRRWWSWTHRRPALLKRCGARDCGYRKRTTTCYGASV